MSTTSTPAVLTIGRPVPTQIKDELQKKLLRPANGQKFLPSSLLWGDDEALRLFEAYSTLPEYYPTDDEINLLRDRGADIARHIAPGSAVIDLGCGDVHKVKPLLDTLDAAGVPVKYYALDLSAESLERNVAKLRAAGYKHVECTGLNGTFDDVKRWAAGVDEPIVYLSLGSIFGNDEFDVAVQDLKGWREAMRPGDRMLIGLDGCQDKDRVWRSYNTPIPGKPNLVQHGLAISNDILGATWYRPEQWRVEGVSEHQGSVCTHQWEVTALEDNSCEALGLHFSRGDKILTTKWFKWDPEGMKSQFEASGLERLAYWTSPTGPFYQHLVKPAQA